MASTLVVIDEDGNKHYLDVLKGQPITADFNFKDITDLKTKGSHTYSFRLPSSETNDKYFATYFMVGSFCDPSTNSNFNPYYKADAYLLQDTIEVFDGSLQLVNVFLRDGNRYEYEVILYSNDVSLMDELKGVFMNEIDFSDYNHLPSLNNVYNSYANNNIANGDCVYSLFDYGMGLASSQAPNYFGATTNQVFNFTEGINIEHLRPQIRLSALLTKVLAHKGYTYSSDFFASSTIQKLYCDVNFGGSDSLVSNTPLAYYKVRARNTGTQTFDYGDSTVRLSTPTEDVDLDNNFNPSTSLFDVPYDGVYQYIVKVTLSGQAGNMGANSPCRLGVFMQVGQLDLLISYLGNEFNIGSGTEQTLTGQIDTTIPIPLANGSEINIGASTNLFVKFITPTNTANPVGDVVSVTNSSLQIDLVSANITDGQVSINQLFGNLKVIDFLSGIISKFNLTLVPDKNNSKHLSIEPYDDFMNNTTASKDWSKKLDFTKDVQIVPPNKIAGREALFRDTPSDDYIYQSIARGTSYTVGEFRYDIGNKFTEKINEFTSIFNPTINYPIQDAGIYTSPIFTLDSDGYKNVGGIRLSFYHGTVTVANGLKYSLKFAEGSDEESFSYKHNNTIAPYFSAFSEKEFENDNTVFTINYGCTWSEQLGLWETLPTKGTALKYWLSYITNNFEKNARMLIAYFRLKPDDIHDFKFNDIIKVNGEDYVVNSIKGYPINSSSICKVELLKTSIAFGEFPPNYNPLTGETCPSFNALSLTADLEFLAGGNSISEECCDTLQQSVGIGIFAQGKCWWVAPNIVSQDPTGGGVIGRMANINNTIVGGQNRFNFLQGGSIQGSENNVVNGGRDIKINGNKNNIRSATSKLDITGDENIVFENSSDVTIIGKGNMVKPATDNFTLNGQSVVYSNSLKNIRITGDFALALNNNEVITSTSERNLLGTNQTVEHIVKAVTTGGSREAFIGQLGTFDYPTGTSYNGGLGSNCFRLPAKTLINLTITLQATTGTTSKTLNREYWELVQEYKILSGTAPIILSENQVSQTQTNAFNNATLDLQPTSNIPYLYNAYLIFLRLPFSTLTEDSKYLIKTKYTTTQLSGTVTSNILPTDISGLKLWLDSTNLASISFNNIEASGQPITQWNDLSGGANNLLQNQPTYMPKWNSGQGFNGGRPYVDFDGTTAFLFNTDADLVGLASSDNTFIVVFESNTTNQETFGQVVLGINTITGLPRVGISVNNSSTYGGAGADSVSYYNENTFTNMYQCNIASAGVTDKKIVVGRRNGTDLDISDENDSTDTYTTATSPTDAHYFTVGGRFNGSIDFAEFNGRIHEIICYDNKISDADKDKLVFYLKNKWNIE